MKKYKIICSIIILCAVLFVTVGFSAFNKELFVDDVTGFFEVYKDVRLTDAKFERSTTGVVANNIENGIYNLYAQVILPNADSSVTFRVDMTNYGEREQVLMNIAGLPDNLEYELENYTFYDKICDPNWNCNLGVTKELLITIKHKDDLEISYPDNTVYNLNLEFQFGFIGYYQVLDKSGNNNHLRYVGATFDKSTQSMNLDGVNDYMYTRDAVDYKGSTAFTIDFVAKIDATDKNKTVMLFESSYNSTLHDGAYYITVNEFEHYANDPNVKNDLTLAMRYNTPTSNIRNQKHSIDYIDSDRFARYTITFNSANNLSPGPNGTNLYTKMYRDGELKTVSSMTTTFNDNIDNRTLNNYVFYIGVRRNEESNLPQLLGKFMLKELKLYNKELTPSQIDEGSNDDALLLYYNFE